MYPYTRFSVTGYYTIEDMTPYRLTEDERSRTRTDGAVIYSFLPTLSGGFSWEQIKGTEQSERIRTQTMRKKTPKQGETSTETKDTKPNIHII